MDWCAQACKQKFFMSPFVWTKNVRWRRTDVYCLLPPVPSLFHPWALTACFLFHPLPTVLFLSISSRLPPSSFLLFPTPPPPLSLFKHFCWYGASFSSSFFNCHSFYQPSFLWLLLAITFLCSERFMLNYFFRSAFETWKRAVKENREERQNESFAEAFQNQTLLSRVSETENYITWSFD